MLKKAKGRAGVRKEGEEAGEENQFYEARCGLCEVTRPFDSPTPEIIWKKSPEMRDEAPRQGCGVMCNVEN